ncbi:hypothetical protein BJ508DRAFT_314250 [Ascobolus immersus RN42]|uniref:Uncharacterized protein n=1 Tax=Ascobolus immersus RN42 TaxID=1160509 RepID=A0A3N4HFS3_ASCIM|nr:hypothetical protein BJ508DRAFT_314250 [Ascobolus immersus RN42]
MPYPSRSQTSKKRCLSPVLATPILRAESTKRRRIHISPPPIPATSESARSKLFSAVRESLSTLQAEENGLTTPILRAGTTKGRCISKPTTSATSATSSRSPELSPRVDAYTHRAPATRKRSPLVLDLDIGPREDSGVRYRRLMEESPEAPMVARGAVFMGLGPNGSSASAGKALRRASGASRGPSESGSGTTTPRQQRSSLGSQLMTFKDVASLDMDNEKHYIVKVRDLSPNALDNVDDYNYNSTEIRLFRRLATTIDQNIEKLAAQVTGRGTRNNDTSLVLFRGVGAAYAAGFLADCGFPSCAVSHRNALGPGVYLTTHFESAVHYSKPPGGRFPSANGHHKTHLFPKGGIFAFRPYGGAFEGYKVVEYELGDPVWEAIVIGNLHGPTQPNKQADFTGLTVAQYQQYVAADVIIGPLVGNYTAVQNLGVRPIAALKSNRGFDQSQRGSSRIKSSTQSGKALAAQPDQPPNPEDVIIDERWRTESLGDRAKGLLNAEVVLGQDVTRLFCLLHLLKKFHAKLPRGLNLDGVIQSKQ